jgi:hypothetical protein
MSEIYEALKRAEAERAARCPYVFNEGHAEWEDERRCQLPAGHGDHHAWMRAKASLPRLGESRLDREVLNELGAAVGRVEACLATHKANWEGIVVGLNLLGAKLDAIQAALLVGDFERRGVATPPRPRRSRKGRRK